MVVECISDKTSINICQKCPVDSVDRQYLITDKSIAATSMDKAEIIKILQSEDWTKADALRAIESIDFSTNPDELTIRRNISSQFAGRELVKRQREQAAQKGLVTKKTNQLELLKREYQAHIKQGSLPPDRSKQQVIGEDSPEQYDIHNQQLLARVKELEGLSWVYGGNVAIAEFSPSLNFNIW